MNLPPHPDVEAARQACRTDAYNQQFNRGVLLPDKGPPVPAVPMTFGTACLVVALAFVAFCGVCWAVSLAFGVRL